MASFAEWTEKEKKKKKKQASGASFTEYTKQVLGRDDIEAPLSERKEEDIAPVVAHSDAEEHNILDALNPFRKENWQEFGDFVSDRASRVKQAFVDDFTGKDTRDKIKEAEEKGESTFGEYVLGHANEGLASFNKGITATADLILGKPLQAIGWENNPISSLADYYGERYDEFHTLGQTVDANRGGGKMTTLGGEFISGTVAAIPNALLALMSMGGSTAATTTSAGLQTTAAMNTGNILTRAGLKTTAMMKNPQYWLSFAQTAGTDYEEAKAMGASDEVAAIGATLTSLINAGIEVGLNGGSGIQGLPDEIASGDGSKILAWVMSSLEEGNEEEVQGVVNRTVAKVLYGSEEKIFDSGVMAKEFAMGTAVGGALGGGQIGVQGAVNAANNAIANAEARKLTANEQAVVDKVVEDRIAEEEQDGKKLTNSEKKKIRNAVFEEMERGEISIDTIEEVLGGDSYKAYRDTVDSEDALAKEFEELGNKQNATLAEQSRYAELKQQMEDIKQNGKRNELKTQLSDTVFGMVQNDRLAESYYERGRRGQAFQADVSKYDEKQRAVVQNAIDSGILNNTRRTHEFVDIIARLSADRGVLFDFTDNAKLKESGFAIDGKQVNGFVTKDGITLNIDSPKAWQSTVGHEVTHVLEGTELYGELQTALFDYAKSKGEYDSRLADLTDLYSNIEGADVNAELTADLVGDYLFTDSDFIHNLSTNHRNVFQKIYDEIKYLCKVVTAGSKEARQLEKVKKAFDKAYKEGGKATDGTKYSVSNKNIKDVSTGYASGETYFTMSYTQDGKVVGTLEYGEYEGAPNVKMVEVAPEYRRQGIGKKLLQELQTKYPDTEIDFGMSTPDGTKLLESITYNVTDEAVVADRQKLKDLQSELNELQGKLDVLYDTDNLTEAQEAELHKLGDRWTEVYDTIRELEQSLRGKRATKTFVKTDAKYSISDNSGRQLTTEQREYFKDSKMRDDNGNLMVMYHGSQDAGFHVFDAKMSDDDTSFFFVDRNDVAASYSGTSEVYEAKTIRTADDMNNFLAEIGYDHYKAVEENGKFVLYENNEYVAKSDTAQGIYEEFCWYEGVGDGDANYKVYLNLKNPLIVDAQGRNWDNVSREYSQELANRYRSLTTEEKEALVQLAAWEDYSIFQDELAKSVQVDGYDETGVIRNAYAKLVGKDTFDGDEVNRFDLFSIASDNFSDEAIQQFAVEQMTTRDFANRAKEQGYDGVIFKNIVDVGGYGNGSEGASTVAVAFDSKQIKSVANEKPTADKDIRYSLTEYTEAEKKAHNDMVIDHFGKTYSWAETGYVLLDGTKLDLSGKHEGAPGGYRTVDHRDIVDALGSDYGDDSYSGALVQFMSEGNIRISPESNGINLSVRPNKAQERALTDFISRARGEVILDIDDANGYTVVSVEYPYGTHFSKVLGDIRGWFDNGTKPDVPSIYRSLSKEGETPVRGRFSTPARDLKLETAPVAETVSEMETVAENATTTPSPVDLAEIAKQGRRENMRGAYTHNGKQYLSDGSFIAEFNTVDEGLEQSKDFPIKQALKELDEAFARRVEGNYDLHASDTPGFIKVGNSLFGTKRVNALFRAFENPVFSLANVRGGHEALVVTADNGRAVLMPVSASGNAYLVYEAQPVSENVTVEEATPKSWRDTVKTLREPEMDGDSWSREYIEYHNAFSNSVVHEALNEVMTNAEVGMSSAELAQKAQEALREYEQIQANKPYGESYTEAEMLELSTLYTQYTMYDGLARNPAYIDELMSLLEYSAPTESELSEQDADRLASLEDTDAPPEVEAPYYEESKPAKVYDPFYDRDIGEVGKRSVKAYMYENPEVKPFFQQEAQGMLNDLSGSVKGERWLTSEGAPGSYGLESYGTWNGTKRHTTDDIAELLDVYGYSYAEIEKGLKAIIEDNGAENNACSKRIEFMLNDRLVYGYTDVDGRPIPPDQDYINLLQEKQITEYSREAFDALTDADAPPVDEVAPVAPVKQTAPVVAENIAPVKEAYEAIKPKKEKQPRLIRVDDDGGNPGEEITAKTLVNEPKKQRNKRGLWSLVKEYVLDNGMVFEEVALRNNNRELQSKWHFIRGAQAMAQRFMGKGANGVRALNDIRKEVEKSGKVEPFYQYLQHMLNTDRMTLAERYGTENKPVFGKSVTAEMSSKTAAELEAANPEFKQWAEDIYTIQRHLRSMMVEKGVISQETADMWNEMYPHYVPIGREGKDGAAVNVALDTGRTGVNAPIKRATGGNANIRPMFNVMGERIVQTFRANAKNSFGVELFNTLNAEALANDAAQANSEALAEAIFGDTEGVTENEDGLLKEGKNGAPPTFTVFVDGKRVEFAITDEMYTALKPAGELLSYTNKPLNTINNIRRGLITEYNPVFLATNAVKDVQDVLMNSQHPVKTYLALPRAAGQIVRNGKWYTEYLDNGGESNTYFDNESSTFTDGEKGASKLLGIPPLSWISKANNVIERLPRLAEYIASREAGRSIETSMLDAARVTTNFAAGGKVTKLINRNGGTFFAASVNGAVQQARNIVEAKHNGLRGVLGLAGKMAIAGLPAMVFNALRWDDDEDYAELSDYVKRDYYVVAKYGDGQFIRIPKGRVLAVIQNAFEQGANAVNGEDVDLWGLGELMLSNIAPNNPIDNNIFAPVIQAATNRAWYGDDILPTRLQDLPTNEQYDETTDAISKWLGENFDPFKLGAYKINYLLDQYSGGLGDTFLPMLTPKAERGDNSLVGNMIAPFKDKFTTDSVLKNQNVSDFYDTKDELATAAKRGGATDEEVLMSKYMNTVNAELSELYAEKREIQNSDLPDDRKYARVREVQEQINAIARDGLSAYENVTIDGKHAKVGDVQFRWYEPGEDSTAEPGWKKLTADQLEQQEEVTRGLGISAGEYWNNKAEYDFAYEKPEKYAVAKSVGGYEAYKGYQSALYDIKADKDSKGKSITGSRKEKVADYINGLDADYGEKIILFKSEYKADDTYNHEIIEYLNSRDDISYKDMVTILKELGFEVDSEGNIYWD